MSASSLRRVAGIGMGYRGLARNARRATGDLRAPEAGEERHLARRTVHLGSMSGRREVLGMLAR